MKNLSIFFCALGIIGLIVIGLMLPSDKGEYLRIHVRANSNSQVDQSIKYDVKDLVVDFLTPHLTNCKTKNESITKINSLVNNIENLIDSFLEKNNFSYKSSVGVKKEEFPTRVYNELTLNAGVYDAIIINLGSGKGDNWWCVAYPPLCFVGHGESYYYKSKLLEIINEFFDK